MVRLLEGVQIFNSSEIVNSSSAREDISDLRRCECSIVPQRFGERASTAERMRKPLFNCRRNTKSDILLSYLDDCDLSPTHHVVGRSLASVLNHHADTRDVESCWLRWREYTAFAEPYIFWLDIGSQLASAVDDHYPDGSNQSTELKATHDNSDGSNFVAESLCVYGTSKPDENRHNGVYNDSDNP